MISSTSIATFFRSKCVPFIVCFAMTYSFALAQTEPPKPAPKPQTFAESVAEKTTDAAHKAADATGAAAHKAAEAADKAYQSVSETAEKAYDSAAETTRNAIDSAAATTGKATDAVTRKATDTAERIEHTVNRPLTETGAAARNTTGVLLAFGGILLAALVLWMVYRSFYPHEIPPGERTSVDRR